MYVALLYYWTFALATSQLLAPVLTRLRKPPALTDRTSAIREQGYQVQSGVRGEEYVRFQTFSDSLQRPSGTDRTAQLPQRAASTATASSPTSARNAVVHMAQFLSDRGQKMLRGVR